MTIVVCSVILATFLYFQMSTEEQFSLDVSGIASTSSDLENIDVVNDEAVNASVQFVEQGTCISPLPTNIPLQNALNTRVHSYVFDELSNGVPYRSLYIGLSGLGIPGDQVLRTQIDLVFSQFRDDVIAKTYENPGDFENVVITQTINSLPKGADLSTVENFIQRGMINGQTGLYFYNEQQVALSAFGVIFLHYLNTASTDEVSASLQALSHGYRPSNYDILTFMYFGLEEPFINSLIQELDPNSNINTIITLPGYGQQNILSAAIQLRKLSVYKMAVDNGAFLITPVATTTLKEFIKESPNEFLYDFFQANLTPVKERDAKGILNTLSEMSLPAELINLAEAKLAFEPLDIPPSEKQYIDSIQADISLLLFSEISVYYKELTRDCFNQLANNFIGLIDWRHQNVKEFLKAIETEPRKLEDIVRQRNTFKPNISFPQNETPTLLYPSTQLDIDLNKEELQKIAALNKNKNFDEIDQLLEEKGYEPEDQGALLFKLTIAVLGDHENRFVQLVPQLEYLPPEFLGLLLNFTDGVSAAKALVNNGHNISQSYSLPQTNLLIDAVSVGRFELFSYLNSIAVPTQETMNAYNALDHALIRLARQNDWRFVDALMSRNLLLSDSNKQVLKQLKQHSPSLVLELETKYPSLRID